MSWRNLAIGVSLLAMAQVSGAKPIEGPFFPESMTSDLPRPPWPRRRRTNVEGMRAKGQGLIDQRRWPAEPVSPDPVDEQQLGRALRTLCAEWMPPRRPLRYARWIITYSRQFGVDPFLLAALIYRQSRCLPQESNDYGTGLAMIHERMHGGYIHGRRYRYWVLRGGAWDPRELAIDRFAFVPGNLARAEPSIYFAAALLSMYKQQCPDIDGAFRSVPHRHFVSHFVWGDRVRDAGPEDRVLRARRRLIRYYNDTLPAPRGGVGSLRIHCPLDGSPRKVTSTMGSERAQGQRFHRGIDFASTYGEPVRAVADGRVILAGLDRPRGGPINVPPAETRGIKRSQMGPGGLFVMIDHGEGLVSAYMHLASYSVEAGQQVKGAQIIGIVGRTGVQDSGSHLHFEFRREGRHIDPMPGLAPYVFRPEDTYQGRRLAAEERRIRRKRRIERRRVLRATAKGSAAVLK